MSETDRYGESLPARKIQSMIEGEKEETRERGEGRERGREREREKEQKNMVEQLHFHFLKCDNSGGRGGRHYIIS
jgi:hypothetical protein